MCGVISLFQSRRAASWLLAFLALTSSPSRARTICSWSMSRLPIDSSKRSGFSWAANGCDSADITYDIGSSHDQRKDRAPSSSATGAAKTTRSGIDDGVRDVDIVYAPIVTLAVLTFLMIAW